MVSGNNFSRHVQNISEKNDRTLLKDNIRQPEKYSGKGRLNFIKRSVLPNLYPIFTMIPIKSPI